MFKASNPQNIVCAALLLVLCVFTANAWVADDAFITFRVVDNFVHGYGLRWNIDERVQVYTHPLWMLAHIPLQYLTGNSFLSTIGLSLALTGLSLWLLLDCVVLSVPAQLLLLALAGLSTTLHDHMVSGLESPLAAALILAFWRTALKTPERVVLAFTYAALAMLTRLDTAVLLGLPMLHLWARSGWPVRVRAVLALWPLALWFGFCLFYYGFALPNTKYAKLNTGIPFENYLIQGAYYVRDFITSYDVFSGAWLLVGVGYTCWRILKKSAPPLPDLTMLNAIAILAYLGYVMAVGGDFMGGRFMALPLVLSLLLMAQLWPSLSRKQALLGAGAALLMAGVQHWQYQPRDTDAIIAHRGIADERYFYLEQNTLFPPTGGLRTEITGTWREQGEEAKAQGGVLAFDFTGVYGYYAGAGVTILDSNALSDPLLARLPIPDINSWRIGHFTRELPTSYLLARQGNENAMPESLKNYYDKLRLVTSGELLSAERLDAIMGFQLGRYEHWRTQYLSEQRGGK